MDRISNSDDNYEMGYQPSPSSLDQNDSFCRTNSEVSAFSERTDDSSYCDTPSPVHWPAMKSPKLSRLGMNQHNKNLEEDKSHDYATQDLGKFSSLFFLI